MADKKEHSLIINGKEYSVMAVGTAYPYQVINVAGSDHDFRDPD